MDTIVGSGGHCVICELLRVSLITQIPLRLLAQMVHPGTRLTSIVPRPSLLYISNNVLSRVGKYRTNQGITKRSLGNLGLSIFGASTVLYHIVGI